jgi:hypothetical protein
MSDVFRDFCWLIFLLFGMVMAAREVSSAAARRRDLQITFGKSERGQ